MCHFYSFQISEQASRHTRVCRKEITRKANGKTKRHGAAFFVDKGEDLRTEWIVRNKANEQLTPKAKGVVDSIPRERSILGRVVFGNHKISEVPEHVSYISARSTQLGQRTD